MSETHPKDRAVEPEDPMSLHADSVEGDPSAMVDSLIEEYARLGWDAPRIENLFRQQFFMATASLGELYGEEGIRERVTAVLARFGVHRFRTTVPAGTGNDED